MLCASDSDKDIVVALYSAGRSTTECAMEMAWPLTRIRRVLLERGVQLRTIGAGQKTSRLRAAYSQRQRGTKRGPMPDERKRKISQARLAWAALHAKGVTKKPSGYLEYTRGPYKGRSVHRVMTEKELGRTLAPNEHVHHDDENKANNSIDNRLVMSPSEHARLHRLRDIERGLKLEERLMKGAR